MKKILIIPFLAIGLVACQPDEPLKLVATQYRVVDIPPALYAQCPEVGKLPPYSRLTDRQVAQVVVRLYNNNVRCRAAMDAIKDFMLQAKKNIETPNVGGRQIY